MLGFGGSNSPSTPWPQMFKEVVRDAADFAGQSVRLSSHKAERSCWPLQGRSQACPPCKHPSLSTSQSGAALLADMKLSLGLRKDRQDKLVSAMSVSWRKSQR